MNTTIVDQSLQYVIEDFYIPGGLASSFSFLSIVFSIIIIVVVWRIKDRLHTVNHLLICNTCMTSMLYCGAIINSYIYLLFIQWNTSDQYHTRIFLQAASRFCIFVLSAKYRWLTAVKTHYIVVCIQWFVIFILVTLSVLTDNIHFTATDLCWVPTEYTLHTIYTYVAYYAIPIVPTVVIYIYIFYQVRQAKKNATTLSNSLLRQKRDLQFLRNMIVLVSIYLGGGLPSMVADSTSSKLPYLAICVANICSIGIDRALRQVIKNMICRNTAVMPFSTAYSTVARMQQNTYTKKQTNVPPKTRRTEQ